ncbi:MAG TPA: thioredoxin domain-containing protein [Caulobacteraceae bacterium]|nr:thioredoxin domain-containing protein [Caulobacteraceae bacterium]
MSHLAGHRRAVFGGVIALGLLGLGARTAPALHDDDMAMGDPTARVTVIEYASVGCPHCALWAKTVFPAFKKKYIDTGRVRFVFREMLTGQATLAAAGFLAARCAGRARYFDVIDAIFRNQEAILDAGDAFAPLLRIDMANGVTEDQFSACMKAPSALKALEARSDRNATDGKVTGTPTFVVGGRKLEGEQSLADLDVAIAAARRRRSAR